MIKRRLAVAVLSLSAAGLFGIVKHEGFSERATVPTKNDRPTNCFGMTFRPDGSPVQLGDPCTPVEGIERSVNHIAKDETGLKRCVTGELSQAEYDILVDWTYQYGTQAACKSSIVRHINAGRYPEACEAYTLYKYSGGYDCSTTINGKPNKRCWGVWQRNLERRNRCMEAVNGIGTDSGTTDRG